MSAIGENGHRSGLQDHDLPPMGAAGVRIRQYPIDAWLGPDMPCCCAKIAGAPPGCRRGAECDVRTGVPRRRARPTLASSNCLPRLARVAPGRVDRRAPRSSRLHSRSSSNPAPTSPAPNLESASLYVASANPPSARRPAARRCIKLLDHFGDAPSRSLRRLMGWRAREPEGSSSASPARFHQEARCARPVPACGRGTEQSGRSTNGDNRPIDGPTKFL